MVPWTSMAVRRQADDWGHRISDMGPPELQHSGPVAQWYNARHPPWPPCNFARGRRRVWCWDIDCPQVALPNPRLSPIPPHFPNLIAVVIGLQGSVHGWPRGILLTCAGWLHKGHHHGLLDPTGFSLIGISDARVWPLLCAGWPPAVQLHHQNAAGEVRGRSTLSCWEFGSLVGVNTTTILLLLRLTTYD